MKSRTHRWILGLMTACAAVACGDRMATEPQAAVVQPANASTAAPSGVVRLLKRTDALPSPLTASGVIGPRGGHLQIGRAGIRVDFPRGAVAEPTRITVTALPGQNVAYHFEPHGITFAKPVTVRQSLRRTVAWKNPALAAQLQGSYFERLLVDTTRSFARSLERRAGNLTDAGRMLEFSIEHFSGYMVSTGDLGIRVEVEIEVPLR